METLFVDEIVDVCIGHFNEQSKTKSDAQIQALYSNSYPIFKIEDKLALTEHLLTICFGDFIHPQLFVFVTQTVKQAKTWYERLRKMSLRHYQKPQELFYYWRRLFAKVRCLKPEDQQLTTDM